MGTVIVALGLGGAALVRHWRDLPLALLPVVFGTHQLIEAHIWSESPGTGATVHGAAVTAWTFIAFALLPAYAPLALLLAERQRNRLQYAAAAVGVPVFAVMLGVVIHGTHATDRGRVMDYGGGVPLLWLVLAGYLVATCVPFLTSPEPTMRELGIGVSVGVGIAALTDVSGFASVWCAFAAVVSLLIIRRTVHASKNLRPALI